MADIDSALQILSRNNYKLTKQRKELLKYLYQFQSEYINVSQVKYQCDFDHFHHHHFICTNCGKVRELDECPMEQFARQLPGYRITGHRFEIYGICDECMQKFKNR